VERVTLEWSERVRRVVAPGGEILKRADGRGGRGHRGDLRGGHRRRVAAPVAGEKEAHPGRDGFG